MHRKFAIFSMLLAVGYCVPAHAQPGPFTPLIFTAANPDGTACSSSSPLRYYTTTNTVYGCSSGAYAAISGSGTGTVTSVTLAGTANQITATGTCTGTTTISCTLSIPSGFVLPGTVNGLTITTTTGTITVTNGKTLSVAKTLTLDGTDGVTITFPASSATVATLGLTNVFTGRQDGTGAASTALKTGTSLPGTCIVGDLYFKSDATAGQNIYECQTTNTWTQQLNSGGGGGGSLVMTTGTGAPSANCTAPSSSNLAVYFDTTGQDQWFCYSTNSWKKVYAGVPGAYVVTGTTGTAPSNPASGSVTCYYSSVSLTQICLDTSGNAFTMVAAVSCSAGNHISAISAAGIGTCTADTPAAASANVPFTPMRWIYGGGGAPFAEAMPTANTIFQKFPLTVGGTFSSGSISVDTQQASSHVMYGIYSSPCGSGTTLVGQLTFSTASAGVSTATFSSPIVLAGNAEYYVGITSDTAGVKVLTIPLANVATINLFNARTTGTNIDKTFTTGNVTATGTTMPANCGTLSASTSFDAALLVLWP